ncbi:MAG TPA: hypothetical protein VGK18_01065 [Propionicimonas sp.]|uniref:hypothetical protein n=1 Tax=Propionicimonas sp. TaxID=1955623 RepID=UPI002F422369
MIPRTVMPPDLSLLLIGGPNAVLGGEAAGYLSGLLREPPDQVLVHTPNRRPRDQR